MIYVVAPFESENIVKGISSRNIELLKALSVSNKTMLLLSDFDHRYKKRNDRGLVSNNLYGWGVEHKYLPSLKYNNNISILRVLCNFVFSISLFFYLIFRVKKGDKIYINSIPPEVILFCGIIKRTRNIELVIDVRDIWPDALINSSRPSLMLKCFEFYCESIYSFSASQVDKVFYVAPSFMGWIDKKFDSRIPRFFFPLGYDIERWKDYDDEHGDIDLSSERINIAYVGYLSQQFDLDNVIAAFEGLDNDFNLHILGGGDNFSYYRTKFQHIKNVEFHGMVHPKFISNNLHKFDAGFLPLRSGACSLLPNKFFDYLASSVPIISFGSNDVESLINASGGGWVVDNDLVKIKDFLMNLKRQDIELCKDKVSVSKENYSMQRLCLEASSKL
ncbi:glycosyltransferase [Vibrio fluvialis]|uniref:glycosyltransferase n=1 Tax=Vibrio fluvialis TaxID=676 RepID=UPI00399A8347